MTDSLRSYRAIFWTLAIVGAALDLLSKYAMFAWLDEGAESPIITDILSLVHPLHLNRGALFGLGNEHGAASNAVFATVSGIAVIAIIVWSTRPQTLADPWLAPALGLILAGAIGNLFDRLVFGGVRDFIWVRYRDFNWPVFNIADSCLVCGAGLLLLQAFFVKHSTVEGQPAQKAAQKAV